LIVTTANTDLTGDVWTCRRVKELEATAKLVYYGAKLIQLVETLGPPVP
jgi:hypothetical protein